MMAIAKLKEFTGVTTIAPQSIEAHETEQALRDATFTFEIQLHDLRSEFLHRESRLRDDYLSKVAAITAAE